jgi:hypothetical protein
MIFFLCKSLSNIFKLVKPHHLQSTRKDFPMAGAHMFNPSFTPQPRGAEYWYMNVMKMPPYGLESMQRRVEEMIQMSNHHYAAGLAKKSK